VPQSKDDPASVGLTRKGPLAGLRIIAVEQFGAGPFGTLYLSDLGAEVIKIEDPATGGDVSRFIPPGHVGTDSLYFEAFNRGKKSIALDLKNPAGREVFDRLVVSADAVYSNLRGDQPERLGLTYAQLGRVNPRIVCVALTGYGRNMPEAELPGYDALVQAESGWAALTGDPLGPPTKSGLSLADYIGGLTAALALLAGVIDARREGRGRDLDTNLYDSALAMLSYPATWYLSSGVKSERHPLSAHPSIVPFQFFETLDGHIAVAAAKEKFFDALVAGLDLPELAADPRFGSFAARSEHRSELLVILAARFRTGTTEAWISRLRGRVPIGPVRSMEQALDPVGLAERQMLVDYDHPSLGRVRSVGLPVRVGEYTPRYARGPRLGEDATSILGGLGYSAAEVSALAEQGAFGKHRE
jgi:crotonobetainyl-CoA:carnitine CoA-transferase CaiB-like acyl-CoA transferase